MTLFREKIFITLHLCHEKSQNELILLFGNERNNFILSLNEEHENVLKSNFRFKACS